MVTEYRFTCNKCKFDFVVKGYWWNQMVLHHYLDYKYIWHCILHHKDKWNRNDIKRFTIDTLIWIPLIALQVIVIIVYPIKML